MYYLIFFIISSLIGSQEFSWSKINEINEGWDYLFRTNNNYDAIAVGVGLEEYNPMQIYFREDNNWQEIPGNNLPASMIDDLYLTDSQDIYVCDFAWGLFKTSNLGESWTEIGELTNEGCSAFNIHEDGTFFVGMTYTGIGFIHRSVNNGISWESISLPDYDSNYPVQHIEFDSYGNIYLGTINGIYTSQDSGDSWNKMNSGLGGLHVGSLFIDENDYIYIYTTYSSLADGMYVSTDYSNSWQTIPIPDYYVVDITAKNNKLLIIDGNNNIQLSNDMGNSWEQSNDNLNDSYLVSLHLGSDNFIYSGGRFIHQTDQLFEVELTGDINNDGNIDILDIIMAVDAILNYEYNINIDFNEDNIINIIDIIHLINLILNN